VLKLRETMLLSAQLEQWPPELVSTSPLDVLLPLGVLEALRVLPALPALPVLPVLPVLQELPVKVQNSSLSTRSARGSSLG